MDSFQEKNVISKQSIRIYSDKSGKDLIDAIRAIACFAYQHTTFYQQRYQQLQINPLEINSIEDLPIINQDDLVLNCLDFRSDIDCYRISASSGTTGRPKVVFRSISDFNRSVLNQIRLMEWSNVLSTDRIAIVQPFGISGYGELTLEAAKRIGALALPIGGLSISDETVLELLYFLKATVIDTTPSRLNSLLKISNGHQNRYRPPIRIAMLAGEFCPRFLHAIAKNSWGATIFEQYGSEETDGLGGNQYPRGGISLFNHDFVFEILISENENNNGSISGELIVTSLYHKGTPLIRYNLGDFVKVIQNDPLLTIRILGKVTDCAILYEGTKLYAYQINSALATFGLEEYDWQCTIENNDSYDDLVVVRISNLEIGCPSPDREAILKAIERCSIDMEDSVASGKIKIEVIFEDYAPKTTDRGKQLRIIDKRKPRVTSPKGNENG